MGHSDDELVASTVAELKEIEDRQESRASWHERLADRITALTGTGAFVLANAVWFVVWIGVNLPGAPTQFDPFPFSFLTMVVSLEAIFLSIFVLISANAQAVRAEHRSRLDMQINVMTEREVTKLIGLVSQLASDLGHPHSDTEAQVMEKKVEIERVSEAVERI